MTPFYIGCIVYFGVLTYVASLKTLWPFDFGFAIASASLWGLLAGLVWHAFA